VGCTTPGSIPDRLFSSDLTGAMDGEPGHRFEAPATTRKRWRQRQAPMLVLGFVAGTVTVINAVSAHNGALWVLLGIVLLTVAGWVFGYPRYRSSHLPTGALWAGYASVRLSDLTQAGLVGDIHVRSDRRLKSWTLGLGSLGGRLEVTAGGMRLRLGIVSRFAGATGSTVVPWPDIREIQVGDVPGMINRGVGGGIRIVLQSGAAVDGTFLGTRAALLLALAGSPLGRRLPPGQ